MHSVWSREELEEQIHPWNEVRSIVHRRETMACDLLLWSGYVTAMKKIVSKTFLRKGHFTFHISDWSSHQELIL
jgi:hypothetical protein